MTRATRIAVRELLELLDWRLQERGYAATERACTSYLSLVGLVFHWLLLWRVGMAQGLVRTTFGAADTLLRRDLLDV